MLVKGYLPLRIGHPVAESARQMERGEAVAARTGAAIHEIQVQIGCPQGILDDFVELDGAAVDDNGGFWRKTGAEP